MATVLALSGCGGSGASKPKTVVSPVAVSRTTSSKGTGPLVVAISQKTRHSLEQHLYSATFLSPTRLAIPGIVGSSNCPSVPDKLIVRSPHAIWIKLVTGSWSRTASGRRVEAPHSSGLCLDDLHPVPVVVAINPARIDVHHQMKVSLYYPKAAIRRYKRPVVVTVPPLATARLREEVRVARASNALFSIFPAVPGERRCLIPSADRQRRFAGICQTSVRSRRTMEPSESVTFTESWWPHCPPMVACSPRALRHHTWQVIEGETIVKPGTKPHVYAIHSRGAAAPQLASSRIREELRVARAYSRYFSIFPKVPGLKNSCSIPDGALGTKPFRGMCQTGVHPVVSHAVVAIVTFTERWGPTSSCPAHGYCPVPYEHHATWKVSLGSPLPGKLHVLATSLSGATPPQLYK